MVSPANRRQRNPRFTLDSINRMYRINGRAPTGNKLDTVPPSASIPTHYKLFEF